LDYTLIRSKRRTVSIEVTRDGEVLVRSPLLFPKHKIDLIVEERSAWIEKHLILQAARRAAHPEPDDILRAQLISRAKAELPILVERYASLMGLSFSGITVTGARKRFGSCSAENHLCFSWRLMQYPDEAIEYVVVHELSHIVHKNHGKSFYALVASILPDYKRRQQLLRE